MLTPEQARKLLEEKTGRSHRYLTHLKKASDILPENIRSSVFAILGRNPKGQSYKGDVSNEKRYDAVGFLGKLGAIGRMGIFSVMFPRFAQYVEASWQLMIRQPYQTGYSRKAFRAPNHPKVSLPARANYLYTLFELTAPYGEDLAWYAAWAPYLGWYGHTLSPLFAAAIDAGGAEGDEVFDILAASARGEHEIGAMGRHVTGALMSASHPDGWEIVERMLLAAQREEGLRQTILESVDEAHPEAFRRMLRLIVEHDLARFSATVRAVDVWLGYGWDSSVGVRAINATLSRLLAFLDDPAAIGRALDDADSDPEMIYLALWATAFNNAPDAIPPAARLLKDASVERRFVGAHLLAQLDLPEAYTALLPALEDEDLRVSARAISAMLPNYRYGSGGVFETDDLFERLERIYPRFPDRVRQLEPLVWPWQTLTADRSTVGMLMSHNLGRRSPKRLLPYLSSMDSWLRGRVAQKLAKAGPRDSEARDTLLTLVGDPSGSVREEALKAVKKFKLSYGEAERIEKLLTRKASDLRRGALSLLLGQADAESLASAERLMGAGDRLQRLAGLELVRQLADAKRSVERCRDLAEAYKEKHPTLASEEEPHIEAVLGSGSTPREEWTLDDGLGLINRQNRTVPQEPHSAFLRNNPDKSLVTQAALACLRSLDDLIHGHRQTSIKVEHWGDKKEELLANVTWGLPQPERGVSPEEDAARLPLREVWEEWFRNRPPELRDPDGLELARALPIMLRGSYGFYSDGEPKKKVEKVPWRIKAKRILYGDFYHSELRHPSIVASVLLWMLKLHPPKGVADLALEGTEATSKLVSRSIMAEGIGDSRATSAYWHNNNTWHGWLHLARYHRLYFPNDWENVHHARLWRVIRWATAGDNNDQRRPLFEEVLLAHRAGAATEDDLLHILIGPRPKHDKGYYWGGSGRWLYPELYQLSGRKLPPEYSDFPIVAELVERCRQRILSVELERGDLPTAVSGVAFALRHAGGLDTLVRILRAIGRDNFVRGWSYDSLSRAAIFSHLARSAFPGDGDTRERFAEVVGAMGIPRKRLLELAMYAPQWAGYVEAAVGWDGLAEGVWWVHAHTKDSAWSVDAEIRDSWAAQVSERTALSAQDLLDGAMDVAWFRRVHTALGEERWSELYAAAQYAAGGGGHKRAQLFADAMLGRIGRDEIITRIESKRHQDALRALGLLPIAEDEAERERDVLSRYEAIQEFIRGSRKFGSQRQASEKLAASIAMQNLARTVGYPDPLRLEWAMEARAIGDLADGPLTVTADDVTITLEINGWGEPETTIIRGGKQLKSVPPKVKKLPQVAELLERGRGVKRQASRMRLSLEGAMCRGDRFTGAELRGFAAHPVLWPMIEKLVFIGEGIGGYPVEGGLALRDHAGALHPVGKSEELRIAHPHDLLTGGEWHSWQGELFRAERVQPFKQIFRELYALTAAERADGTVSQRYAGHQVQPRQALALLGGRGWVSHPEEGVRRTFHDLGLSAWITFHEGFYTPSEVDGLTIEGLRFTKRDDWKPLDLESISPRVFSEVMRDLDLVVSVAHRGGVDPEASASTVEMRASLVRETCELLGLENVRLNGTHALIEGELGRYSIHLGSATVHRQPGGAVCIVPVHSQHRGRLFLPFADDDPRTAEVVSKTLLLARDKEIKDPTILEQLLAR